jgi:aspartate aminotransferase
MKFSKRIQSVKPSPTLAVTALSSSLKNQGIDIIGLGPGEPDFDTPQHIKNAAIRAIEAGKTKYTPAGGIEELKNAIAEKFMRDNNLEYRQSEITVNCGGKHSFYNLMQVILNEGDELIVPAPYWVSYPPMVMLAGGKPVIVETDETTSFKITAHQLKIALTSRTKAIVLNSPSNPSGSAYTRKELGELADVIGDRDIILISDDIYESIIYDNFEFSNIANVSDEMKEKTIVLNGVSKTYSMTGWRIGYMAGNEKIIKMVETLQSQSTSNPASISQWAAVEAITGDQSVVQEMVKVFDRRRNLIVNGLNEIPCIECFKPKGAFYTFPNISGIYKLKGFGDINRKYDDEFKSSKFCSYLLEEANVAAVPGIGFGADNYMRLSFATSDDNIKEGLARIRNAIEKLL